MPADLRKVIEDWLKANRTYISPPEVNILAEQIQEYFAAAPRQARHDIVLETANRCMELVTECVPGTTRRRDPDEAVHAIMHEVLQWP